MTNETATFFSEAIHLLDRLEADAMLVQWSQVKDASGLKEAAERVKLIVVVLDEKTGEQAKEISPWVVIAPRAKLTRQAQINLGLLSASTSGAVADGDRIICLAGPLDENGGGSAVDTIQLVTLSDSGPHFKTDFPGNGSIVAPEVFNAILTLAVELAHEGREGRPIGTIFIVGDHKRVLQFSRQAVLNPFAGYDASILSIMTPEMKETIREFSSLDGAFIIDSKGVLVAAGRYLAAGAADVELPQGMGSRHASAASITALSNAVALVISESSGSVTVFRHGQLLASLEKAGPDHLSSEKRG